MRLRWIPPGEFLMGSPPDEPERFDSEGPQHRVRFAQGFWLAETAHARGLSIGLKNDMDQAPELLAHFDWALNEECFQYEECETLLPFIEAGKAVFNVEYSLEAGEFCAQARDMGFNSLKKNLDVDAWRESCD